MINGTPYQFERVKWEADGVDVLVTHTSIDTSVKVNGKILTDYTGWPRGHLTGDYEGTTKVEFAHQEGARFVRELFADNPDPITVTASYEPIDGDTITETYFLKLDEMSTALKKGGEEVMLTLNFLHADVMQIDGDYIIEDRRAA